jgi:CBS domain-containing protein
MTPRQRAGRGDLTDRDVAVRVVGNGLDPNATRVGEIASTDLVALTPERDLDEALALMAREQVRVGVEVAATESRLDLGPREGRVAETPRDRPPVHRS